MTFSLQLYCGPWLHSWVATNARQGGTDVVRSGDEHPIQKFAKACDGLFLIFVRVLSLVGANVEWHDQHVVPFGYSGWTLASCLFFCAVLRRNYLFAKMLGLALPNLTIPSLFLKKFPCYLADWSSFEVPWLGNHVLFSTEFDNTIISST